MLLQPRKFTYKNRQKLRRAVLPCEHKQIYGSVSVALMQPVFFSAKRIFRFKLFLKRSSRKSDITRRAFWVNLFPHLPITRKSKGMRMGKGKGKLMAWFTLMRGGKSIVEFKNLRLGRAEYYSKQVAAKLEVPVKLILMPSKHIKISGAAHTNALLQTYF